MKEKSTIKVATEEITPEKAKAYLARNVSNRRLRRDTVDGYSNDIRAGRWMFTHQGIAFNDRGDLMDGQHRLAAIVQSGCPVTMLVARGLPKSIGKAHTMDAVDRGAVRSISNQLQLQHGYKNSTVMASASVAIGNLCIGSLRSAKITINQVLQILDVFGRHIEEIHRTMVKTYDRRLFRTPVVAAFAFARAVVPHDVDRFIGALKTGANLGETSSALQLRNYLFRPEASELIVGDRSERRQFIHLILNSLHQYSEGEPADCVSTSPDGFIAFAGKQINDVQKVANILGQEPAALDRAEYAKKSGNRSFKSADEAPPLAVDTKRWKPTPAAESLLRDKAISERVHGGNRVAKMQKRIARGELPGAVK